MKFKRIINSLLSAAMIVNLIPFNAMTVSAKTSPNVNLALNKNVIASAEYSTMPASNLTDEDEGSRWSSESKPVQWAYVDLGQEEELNYFRMIWESNENYASSYNIYVSNDINNWGDPVVVQAGNTTKISENLLEESVKGRYVKLEVTEQKGYPNVSCSDFKVMLKDSSMPDEQDPSENIALGKEVFVSDSETSSLSGDKAVDGDTTSKGSRWSSTGKPAWIYLDLGKKQNIKTINLFWERRNATKYEIQVADALSNPMNDNDWKTVKSFTENPSKKDQKILLDKVYNARYVRLYINEYTADDPDGIVTWNSVSLYEMEVYGGDTKQSISDIVNSINIESPKKGDKKLDISNLPNEEGFIVEYNGTDYEQVIGEDLTIYEPITDVTVNVSFKVTNEETKEYKFKECAIKVPGKYTSEEGDNASPIVIPELREWKGRKGNFTITNSSRIIVPSELKEMAETFAEDYKAMSGKALKVVSGVTPKAGDISFTLTKDQSKGLQDEGYLMDISDSITVEAETETGSFWATRTILQILKQNNNITIPKGVTRDYPLYKVRGFILDVGRKTFTMDYLEQVVKEMSWYKLNDFQVHLNDNLIPLENYSSAGKDPMEAYSAFRLESDIKEGGNNGLNKADLTSTDMFYTKNEFNEFIKTSRIYGVNIVPEIDTPAHSLALTKVRPDLRHGTWGRDNDHLALKTKYDECLEFVKSIFDEYMMGEDPVFDDQTIIHVGADEYNADKESYRKFADDMLGYVQDTGRTARIWGSLSQCRGTTPVRSENVQMNLWNFGYANMDEMYEQGFDLINCNDGNYYIVPNAGYYYDYLNDNTMYNLPINSIGGVTIPAGDDQMIGGAFAVWNDMTDYLNNGVSEYDVYDRIGGAMPLFAAKLWGKNDLSLDEAKEKINEIGEDPTVNFDYDVETKSENIAQYNMDDLKDSSSNGYNLTSGSNAEIKEEDGKNVLELKGNESYVQSKLNTVGLNNDLRVKVKRTSSSEEEQILFESEYGSIKAVQKDTGKVGFSRENYDYSFNYELPVNEWVELEFKNELNQISLYVNGNLVDTLGDGEKVEGRPLLATNMFPMQYIGSKTKSFIGYVDDIRLAKNAEYASTMELDYAVWNASEYLKENKNHKLGALIKDSKKIFTKYNPTSQEISEKANEINAILKDLDFEKADYSRVNAYLSLIPEDLSPYTEESVNVLLFVKNSIRGDLPASLQSTVDGYEKSLASALNGLVAKPIKNVNYIDNSIIKATASSYQKDGSDPKNVLDDNTGTMWHTDWNVTTMPHWIDLEMDEPTKVNGLTYVPRQSGLNGTITKYEIQVSDDGVNYTKVKEGTLARNSEAKIIEFDAVTTKHVRLVALEAVNNNGTASEIKLHAVDVKADLEGLNKLIDQASAIEDQGFTVDSWKTLQDKIAEAKALVDSEEPNANDVEIMKTELSVAMVSLILEDNTVEVDKSQLEDLYNKVKYLEKDDYTEESWSLFIKALEKAKSVLNDDLATQEAINNAFNELTDAYDKLVETTPEEGISKDDLQALLNKIEGLDTSKYTQASLKVFENAVKNAQLVLDNTNASKEEIEAAYNNLADALSKLEVKVDKTRLIKLYNKLIKLEKGNYTDGSWNNLKNALDSAKTVIENKDATTEEVEKAIAELENAFNNLKQTEGQSVATGDNGNIGLWFALFVISVAGACFVVLKKENKIS
ncbi:discoidin domain-containing protein [Clostridium paraputrificum]|uniref:discoidin domain-containing protein n=1 Tax=Clostridium paraputrificum TaxID=29363 RepID=UPI00325A8F8C